MCIFDNYNYNDWELLLFFDNFPKGLSSYSKYRWEAIFHLIDVDLSILPFQVRCVENLEIKGILVAL